MILLGNLRPAAWTFWLASRLGGEVQGMMSQAMRAARKLGRDVTAKQQGTVECDYLGVLDGDALWLAVLADKRSGFDQLVLRERSTGRLTLLPTAVDPSADDKRLRLDTRSVLLGAEGIIEPSAAVFDVLVTGSGRSRRVRLDGAVAGSSGPTVTPPSTDGRWQLRPYRTQGGMLSIECCPTPPSCEVLAVTAVPGVIRVVGCLVSAPQGEPQIVLRRRGDGVELHAPLPVEGTRFDVGLPLQGADQSCNPWREGSVESLRQNWRFHSSLRQAGD